MKTVFALILIFSSSFVFGNDLKTSVSTQHLCSYEQGYDENGTEIACEGLHENEGCPLLGTEFTDKCLDQGSDVLFCRDCTILCSEPVSK